MGDTGCDERTDISWTHPMVGVEEDGAADDLAPGVPHSVPRLHWCPNHDTIPHSPAVLDRDDGVSSVGQCPASIDPPGGLYKDRFFSIGADSVYTSQGEPIHLCHLRPGNRIFCKDWGGKDSPDRLFHREFDGTSPVGKGINDPSPGLFER